jgi:hypothetical protein
MAGRRGTDVKSARLIVVVRVLCAMQSMDVYRRETKSQTTKRRIMMRGKYNSYVITGMWGHRARSGAAWPQSRRRRQAEKTRACQLDCRHRSLEPGHATLE